MAWPDKRLYRRTPRKITPTGLRQTNIKIPQPRTPWYSIRQRKYYRTQYVRQVQKDFVLHRRGVYRPNIGPDKLEARAVSHDAIRGTLPERILYLYLVSRFGWSDGIEFTFQSSLNGGRMELGGIVADFIFPYMRIVVQVQGPTHTEFLRMRKDEEQRLALEAMGYSVVYLEMETVYDEYKFENWMRRIFGLATGMGGSGVTYSNATVVTQPMYNDIMEETLDNAEKLDKLIRIAGDILNGLIR